MVVLRYLDALQYNTYFRCWIMHIISLSIVLLTHNIMVKMLLMAWTQLKIYLSMLMVKFQCPESTFNDN